MSDFYLNVKQWGNNILYRGYKNGKKIQVKIPYKPSLYIPTSEESKYKTLHGENLQKKRFDDIKSAKDFIKQYENVENFRIYGNTKFQYGLISELYSKEVSWDFNKIKVAIFDIEVNSDPNSGGFADPQNPFQPIISISLKFLGENKIYLFGFDDFVVPDNVIYIKCKDEWTLLKKFIEIFTLNDPDVLSGYNSNSFDVPYLINRCYKIIGIPETKKLSPWGIINEQKNRKFNPKFNRYDEEQTYDIIGISCIDYLDLFKKYHPDGKSQESYKLDFVAENEIGQKKVEYEGSLHKLYTENKQKFYEYNIKDTILIELLDDKFKLFYLLFTLAYYSKTNIEDPFHQTRIGYSLCLNKLKQENIQMPVKNDNAFVDYEGGFVKSPLLGMFKWVSTVDATSLYPSVINGFNISPETLVEPEDYTENMRKILQKNVSVESILNNDIDLSSLKEDNVCLAPNGQFYRIDKRGFLADIVEELFLKRKEYKKTMLDYEVKLEQIKKQGGNSKELVNKIAKFNALQTATKLVANSIYGSLGAKYFIFYDVRLAESITLAGQLANKWTAKNLNFYLNSLLKTNKDYVIFMDTDSCGINFGDLVDKVIPKNKNQHEIAKILYNMVSQKIQPKIDGFCADLSNILNLYKNTISYKLEKICSSGVFVAKKRYALNVFVNEGVFYNEPKIKVTGLEIVKSSTPKIVRESLKQGVEIILNKDEATLQKFVIEFRNRFNVASVEEISFPRGVNGIAKYSDSVMLYKKGTPIHVRASILYNKVLKDKNLESEFEFIKDGDKIKFCYLKTPNNIRENIIAFPEKLPKQFDLHRYVDYNYMFEKVFEEPLKAITDVVGWNFEKKNSLKRFF